MIKPTLTNCHFPITDLEQAKKKVLNWLQPFDTFCFLDNHQYQLEPHTQECLVAAGVQREIKLPAGHALDQLQAFMNEQAGWLFGHLGYDLKNEIESLSSSHPDSLGFADCYFFEPAVIIRITAEEIIIWAEDPEAIFLQVNACSAGISLEFPETFVIQQRLGQSEYLSILQQLKQHILRGDCYEINFCQEFYAEDAVIDPLSIYTRLSQLSPNPFSALYRVKDQWLICASPERFLKKEGNHLLSQPMKGTAPRVSGDTAADQSQKQHLQHSAKDRSENVMVVDLVRNDLARVCEKGSVKVDELYGVYAFPQVYQMISTVSGQLKPGYSFRDIIRATFPMGSMTGAPKKKVMELIERYEKTRRGIFSGALGYITPGGDFDFNVVIRSLLYNAANHYLSFQAGSGITFYSDPEKEWEECLLKAAAIKKVLGENTGSLPGAGSGRV